MFMAHSKVRGMEWQQKYIVLGCGYDACFWVCAVSAPQDCVGTETGFVLVDTDSCGEGVDRPRQLARLRPVEAGAAGTGEGSDAGVVA